MLSTLNPFLRAVMISPHMLGYRLLDSDYQNMVSDSLFDMNNLRSFNVKPWRFRNNMVFEVRLVLHYPPKALRLDHLLRFPAPQALNRASCFPSMQRA